MHWKSVTAICLAIMTWTHSAAAENRSLDGSGNSTSIPSRGAANTPMIRFGYGSTFANGNGDLVPDSSRANSRDISNAIFAQSTSVPSARGLSDYIWAWGQFVSHDTDLTTSSAGATVNGAAPISVNGPLDPLGPQPIPFVRANYVTGTPPRGSLSGRTPINEVTSYIDASHIYGSDAARAAALRSEGGAGAKLAMSAGNLLPYNTAGLPVENNGPLPDESLFLAGDIRANENSLLTSLHTVFAREHNRLVDVIAAQQPGLDAEGQYQLARKIVGAEMQAITYREFLPALLGNGATTPKAEAYVYRSQTDASITTAYAHAAFRYGHSTVSAQLQLADEAGTTVGSIDVRNAFYNPGVLENAPENVDRLLKGASLQTSQEVDVLVVDELRNFLFGPPGAGGLDLAALNIQRGRDVGLPTYRGLALNRNIQPPATFSGITSDTDLAAALATVYGNDINKVDAWVGMLAEDHVAGSSVGRLLKAEIESQFVRLRDGDRLFYRSTAAGLYDQGGVLLPEIAAIVDLDSLRLSDILLANSSLSDLQTNVFFVPAGGDFNYDGTVDGSDFLVWQRGGSPLPLSSADLNEWKAAMGATAQAANVVPEPATLTFTLLAAAIAMTCQRTRLA